MFDAADDRGPAGLWSRDLERNTAAMARETLLAPPGTVSPSPAGDAGLPAVIPPPPLPPPRRSAWRRVLLAAAVLVAGATGALYWAAHNGPALPPYIAWSNGRLEA